jgi:hypothetical protein
MIRNIKRSESGRQGQVKDRRGAAPLGGWGRPRENRAVPPADAPPPPPIPAAGASIEGVVEDADGRPLSGAWVGIGAAGAGVVVGADATFRLEPGGTSDDLVVRVHGREIRVAAGAEPGDRIRVAFAPPDAVPLRVLTPGSAGVPRRYAWTAFRRPPDGGALAEVAAGDADRPRFLARGLAPGTYGFVVWAGPFLPAVVEPVVLDGVRTHPVVGVELTRRGAAIAGRVLSADGTAQGGVSVVAIRDDGPLRLPARRLAARADAGGRYRIEGLPEGLYGLAVEGVPVAHSVALADREERALDLTV